MGILRTDRVAGLGGANAIKGSVFFGGKGSIEGPASDDFKFCAGGDFTVEAWVNAIKFANAATIVGCWDQTGATGGVGGDSWLLNISSSGVLQFAWSPETVSAYFITGGQLVLNTWHHVALTRSGNTFRIFLDGTQTGTDTNSSSNNTNTTLTIGSYSRTQSAYYWHGYISNVRILKGEALYTSTFTPPKRELTVIENTVFLGCQSPGDITQDATGKDLVGTRSSTNDAFPVATNFTPNSPVGFSTTTNVGTQFGTTFNGVTTFDSQAYMVPPGGNTRERNRGRGVFGGGVNIAPSQTNHIAYINIQSQGNTIKFGDLTSTNKVWTSAFGSSTRAIWPGGAQYNGSNPVDIIDFVTIATTSNATDFGDLSAAKTNVGSHSSQTRGVIAGGYIPSPTNTNINVIEFVTIATTGDASDFGDLTVARRGIAGMGSPTRGVYAGGVGSPTIINTIDFVTIATTGNATDFGDMTQASRHDCGGCSSGTRGVIAGGRAPGNINTIQFLTIASAGNASDFGDLTETMAVPSSLSNSIRGVFSGSYSPDSNTINFVTIASTGNASDFGDNEHSTTGAGATSDSHGGLE